MTLFVLRLDPALLPNPDADLRYALPDALAARSGGNFRGSDWTSFDYENGSDALLLFLEAERGAEASATLLEFLHTEPVLGNSLESATAWVRANESWVPLHPPGHTHPLDVDSW